MTKATRNFSSTVIFIHNLWISFPEDLNDKLILQKKMFQLLYLESNNS